MIRMCLVCVKSFEVVYNFRHCKVEKLLIDYLYGGLHLHQLDSPTSVCTCTLVCGSGGCKVMELAFPRLYPYFCSARKIWTHQLNVELTRNWV